MFLEKGFESRKGTSFTDQYKKSTPTMQSSLETAWSLSEERTGGWLRLALLVEQGDKKVMF